MKREKKKPSRKPPAKNSAGRRPARTPPVLNTTALEDRFGISSQKEAAIRGLRVLIDHAELTPEVVARKIGRSLTDIEVVMDEPLLMCDCFMLWELSLEEHEDILDKCAAALRILIDHDEINQDIINVVASFGYKYLLDIGAFNTPDA